MIKFIKNYFGYKNVRLKIFVFYLCNHFLTVECIYCTGGSTTITNVEMFIEKILFYCKISKKKTNLTRRQNKHLTNKFYYKIMLSVIRKKNK